MNPTASGYDLHDEIGQGSSAVVYRATQRSLNRPVALKVFRYSFERVEQSLVFDTEIAAIGRLSNHPNILQVIEAGVVEDGRPFLALALMKRSLVGAAQPGRARLGLHLKVGAKIAGALAAAHEAGFVHCDVKPGNILMSEYGEPTLTDFGSATYPDSPNGEADYQITLDYAPPELLNGERPVSESDVYAWASTVHELLAGLPPRSRRSGETVAEFARRIQVEPIQLALPIANDALIDLLRSSLEWRADDRPTALEFADAINDVAVDEGFAPAEVVGSLEAVSSRGADWPPSISGSPTGAVAAKPASGFNTRRAVAAVGVLAGALLVGYVATNNSSDSGSPAAPTTSINPPSESERPPTGFSELRALPGHLETTSEIRRDLDALGKSALSVTVAPTFWLDEASIGLTRSAPLQMTVLYDNVVAAANCFGVEVTSVPVTGVAGAVWAVTDYIYVVTRWDVPDPEAVKGLFLATTMTFGAASDECAGWLADDMARAPFTERVTRDKFPMKTVALDRYSSDALVPTTGAQSPFKSLIASVLRTDDRVVTVIVGRTVDAPPDPEIVRQFSTSVERHLLDG